MKDLNLAVLESRWWAGRNTSVKGTFDFLSDLYCGNHHAYSYEMCNSNAAFREAFSRYINTDTDTHYLSLACHGSKAGLQMYNGASVSRTEIRNILRRDDENRRVAGIHIGSCRFGSLDLANFLFMDGNISPWWIAGYRKNVDFVKSSILDLLFFQHIFNNADKDSVRQIQRSAENLKKNAGGLVKSLRFGIYFYDDALEKVVDLLD